MQTLVGDSVRLSSWHTAGSHEPVRRSEKPPAVRIAEFDVRYDFDSVFYDVFWEEDGRRLRAIGPPLLNLDDELVLEFYNWPGGQRCTYETFTHYDGMRYRIDCDAPIQSLRVVSRIGETLLAPQPNLAPYFAGLRAIVTVQQNESLTAIGDWLDFHARLHGANAVVIYDNNSDRYGRDELVDCIRASGHFRQYAVVPWNFRYGPTDHWHPLALWTSDNFCQTGALEHARQRLLSRAAGVLNADIDELVTCEGDHSVFDLLDHSQTGYLTYSGIWIEAAVTAERLQSDLPLRHRDFHHVRSDGYPVAKDPKWCVAPARCHTVSEPVWHPHRVAGARRDALSDAVAYRHLKGINRSWFFHPAEHGLKRGEVHAVDSRVHQPDSVLEVLFDRLYGQDAEKSLAIARPEGLPAALRLMAQAERVRNQPDGRIEAGRLALRASELLPEAANVWAYLAARTDGAASQSAAHRAEELRQADPWFDVMTGRYLYSIERRYEEAQACFDRAIAIEPGLLAAHTFALAALRESAAAPADIVARTEQALRLCGDDPELLLELGWAHLENGEPEKAVAAARAMLQLAPESFHPHKIIGEAELARNRLAEAEDAARTAVALGEYSLAHWPKLKRNRELRRKFAGHWFDVIAEPYPSSPLLGPLYRLLGRILTRRQDAVEAVAALERAAALEGPNAGLMLELSQALAGAGKSDQAKAALDRATTLAANEYQATFAIDRGFRSSERSVMWSINTYSSCLIELGRSDEALALCDRWSERWPNRGIIDIQAARALHVLGRYAEALQRLQRGLRLESEAPWLMTMHGDLLDRTGDHESASTVWRRVAALEGSPPWVLFRVAEAFEKLDDMAAAAAQWRLASEAEPGQAWIWHKLADRLEKTGNDADAAQAWRRAIALESHQAWAFHRLARLLERAGDKQGAAEIWRQAAAIEPDQAWLQYRIAELMAELGDKTAAESAWLRATEIDPGQGWVYHHLARLREERGDIDGAIKALTLAAAVASDSAWTEQRIARLQAKVAESASD